MKLNNNRHEVYLLPNLGLTEAEQRSLGKYGRPLDQYCWTEALGVHQCAQTIRKQMMDKDGLNLPEDGIEQFLRTGTTNLRGEILESIPAKQKGRWKTHKENTVDWEDRGNAVIWRAAAADSINKALREAGFMQGFVDHRSYARQDKERIPMIHEGPEARAMQRRGIPTEVSERNREIRAQNKQLEQMEARLTRLNAWAQYEKKMDEALIAQGEDVSNPYLRYVLASRIFESTVPPNQKDRRLEVVKRAFIRVRKRPQAGKTKDKPGT